MGYSLLSNRLEARFLIVGCMNKAVPVLFRVRVEAPGVVGGRACSGVKKAANTADRLALEALGYPRVQVGHNGRRRQRLGLLLLRSPRQHRHRAAFLAEFLDDAEGSYG
jgi:hypothetical protein